MRLTGSEKLIELCRKHADAAPAIERWKNIVKKAQWKNHADLKKDFLSADFVGRGFHQRQCFHPFCRNT